MLQLIKAFWNQSILACCARGNYGHIFLEERGMTQGGTLLPKLFNVLVDAVIHEWLWRIFGCKLVRLGVGADNEMVCTFLVLIYGVDRYLVL